MITSMMTYWYPAVFDTVGLVQRTFPGIPVVLGGNYVTLYPHHATRSGADFVLAGPGEISIPVLLKNLYNQDMSFIPDADNLDSYPYPAFDLISHAGSRSHHDLQGLSLPLQLLCLSHDQQSVSEARSHPGCR